MIDHLYSVTLRQVQLLETSFSGWVDLTSGIVLDEKRENYTPVGQNERMRAARPYSRQCLRRIYRSDKIRYTLGTDAYHGMLYREVEFAVSLGADRRQGGFAPATAVVNTQLDMTGVPMRPEDLVQTRGKDGDPRKRQIKAGVSFRQVRNPAVSPTVAP